ncbi:MAG: hypothetical protein R3C03_18275 [Pirellulaceae bacterium]
MSHYSLSDRIRYRFDNFMSRGGSSIFVSLLVVFVCLLIIISALRGILLFFLPVDPERGGGALHNIYIAFLQMTDPGNMAQDIDSSPWYKIAAVLGGLSGVVMLSSLIAFITTALDQKIAQLKKGHSKVVESDHTLILGWNERVTEIIRELAIANESEDNPVVVILSPLDKEEMDDYLKLNLPDTKNTRVVTRSGSVSSLVNLDIVSLNTCKSVICLASCNISASDDEKLSSDTSIIKTVLALVASRPDDVQLNIVAEIFFERNRRVVTDISQDEVSTVDTNEILAKILVQTSRSVGLSVVYNEVLSFDGCEMYFHEADWNGIAFGPMAYHFPDGIPMGIRRQDGTLLINPPSDERMQDGDSILILAEDDSTIDFQSSPIAKPRKLKMAGGRRELGQEHNLVIGWTAKVETILREYADYVLEGSRVDIMLRAPDDSVVDRIAELNQELDSIHVSLIDGNPMQTEGLIAVEPFKYDNIIILSQGQGAIDDERTDSETIVILLLLRKIFQDHPEESKNVKLITEILDSENQSLVSKAGVNDFIISNRFVSMVLAQISEDADTQRVYDDLFSEDGSEIYLKPASLYFETLPIEVTYADMIDIAQQREEVCLGVKIKKLEQNMDQNFGVKLIPDKNAVYRLTAEDTLVVLAEDET